MSERVAPPDFAKTMGTLRVIWAAMLASIAVYGVVAFTIEPLGENANDTMTLALAVVAFVQALAVFVVRRVLLGTLGFASPDDLRVSESLDGETLDDALRVGLQRYQTGLLVGMAMAESVAVVGLVSALYSGVTVSYLPYALVAALLIAVQLPTTTGALSVLTPPARVGARRRLGR